MVLLEFLFYTLRDILDQFLNKLSIPFDLDVSKPINHREKS